jgi:hypothetical protein
VKLYNLGLKNGPSNKKFIHLDATNSERINASTLVTQASAASAKLSKKKGPLAQLLSKIRNTLLQHEKVVDIFVQSNPQIFCVVWDSICKLFKVGLKCHAR